MKTPLATNWCLENRAVMTTVQRITVVINRRKKTFAFEGVWVAAATSDIRAKIAGTVAVANSHLRDRAASRFRRNLRLSPMTPFSFPTVLLPEIKKLESVKTPAGTENGLVIISSPP
jgi:hypothetical protein